jgi:hypothetical protein
LSISHTYLKNVQTQLKRRKVKMDTNSKKPSQLEINDLIAEAVVNAEARRNQAEDLLSDEQAATVKGGSSGGKSIFFSRNINLGDPIAIGAVSRAPNDLA